MVQWREALTSCSLSPRRFLSPTLSQCNRLSSSHLRRLSEILRSTHLSCFGIGTYSPLRAWYPPRSLPPFRHNTPVCLRSFHTHACLRAVEHGVDAYRYGAVVIVYIPVNVYASLGFADNCIPVSNFWCLYLQPASNMFTTKSFSLGYTKYMLLSWKLV